MRIKLLNLVRVLIQKNKSMFLEEDGYIETFEALVATTMIMMVFFVLYMPLVFACLENIG